MSKGKKLALVLIPVILLAFIIVPVSAKKYGSNKPWIGVVSQSIDRDLRDAYDLDKIDGVIVVDVIDDSPADEAGLRRKDIILRFNGKKVAKPGGLVKLVGKTKVGDEIDVSFLRKGKEKNATLVVGKRRDSKLEDYFIQEERYQSRAGKDYYSYFSGSYIGIGIQDLNEQLGEYFGVDDGEGVLVTEVHEDSPAEEAGLKAGDIIIAADGEDISETSELKDIIYEHEEGDEVVIEYLRRGNRQKATVEVTDDAAGSSFFGYQHFGGNNFTVPNIHVPDINVPHLRNLDRIYFSHDDDLDFDIDIDMDDYKESMRELKEELEELRQELREIEARLE